MRRLQPNRHLPHDVDCFPTEGIIYVPYILSLQAPIANQSWAVRASSWRLSAPAV